MSTDITFDSASQLYEAGDFEKARSYFIQLAESGDVSAMSQVACMYSAGEGGPVDFEKSIDWDKRAIEKGSRTSLINLGITYRCKGECRTAKHWFEQAILAGDGEAALELAKMLMVSDLEKENVARYLNIALSSGSLCEDSALEVKNMLTTLSHGGL